MALTTAGALLLAALSVTIVSAERLPGTWQLQIDAKRDDADRIIEYVLDGAGKGTTYTKLAHLTDLYGQRLSGTDGLEEAIDYLKGKLETEFDASNVYTEEVMVPHWVRGEEWARFTLPETGRVHDMYIMGIGTSNGTLSQPSVEPNGTLTAPIVVVKNFDELDNCNTNDMARDKIVVYNQEWDGYSNVFMYRSEGASRAAKCGAKAALVRSLTQFSIYSPHTGTQTYHDDLPPEQHIPSACITVEDAQLMQRLVDDGHDITVTMYMEAENRDKKPSRNLYVEIPGTIPDEYVIFGGHIDSWDVGTGAMDDAGGVVVSWQVLSVVKELQLKPKRTLRAIFWTAEEIGASGAHVFFNNHKNKSVSLIMESDAGTFTPTGLGFSGSGLSKSILEETLVLLEGINASLVTDDMTGSVDIDDWMEAGFQSAVLNNVQGSDGYFLFHHTEADTMTVQDTHDLDLCTILWTTAAYVVADFDDMLPTEGDYIPPVVAAAGVTQVSLVAGVGCLLLAVLGTVV